jgi:excisionase family DNA binding protein
MDNQIILTGTTVKALVQEIAKAVSQELAAKLPTDQPAQDDLLSREEAARLLHITLPTLRQRTKEGRLRGYRMGARVLYRRSEVIASLRVEVGPEAPRS